MKFVPDDHWINDLDLAARFPFAGRVSRTKLSAHKYDSVSKSREFNEGGENMVDDLMESKRDEFVAAIYDLEGNRQDVVDQKRQTDDAVNELVSEVDNLVDRYAETREHAVDVYDRAIRLASETSDHCDAFESNLADLERDVRDAYASVEDHGPMPSTDEIDDALDNYGR